MNRRNTIQRELVLDAVKALHCHATADEVYGYIAKAHPTVSRGTVYRNLNLLSEDGEILRVEVAGGPDHFDHNVAPHYHVSCVRCGRAFDVDMETLPDLRKQILDQHGFKFLSYEILFKGICPDCQSVENDGN